MLVSTSAILLHVIPYSDSKLIYNCFSLQFGNVAFLQYQSKSRKKQRSGYFHPLSLIEVSFNNHERITVHALKSVQHKIQLQSLLSNPQKQSIAIFLAEFLNFILKEEEKNVPLYSYMEEAIVSLNELNEGTDWFHLKFMLEISVYTGFFPEIQFDKYNEGASLNLLTGMFEKENSSMHLSGQLSKAWVSLCLLEYDVLKEMDFSGKLRSELLNHIIRYYSIHFPDFKIPKALKIFRGY